MAISSRNEKNASLNGQRGPANLSGLKVLVVEDSDDLRVLVSHVLRRHGAEVILADRAKQGYECALRFHPDVIVSDIAMPDEDGYSMIRRLRDWEKNEGFRTPAVALTAHSREEERYLALSSGFQVHMAKPFDAANLINVIAWLSGRHVGGAQ